MVATRLVANLHDGLGRVNLPGFYDNVRELSEEETLSLGSVPFDEAEFCSQAGVAYLEGEAGRTPYERTGTRPTAEVTGLHAGYGGPGMKTIVPATANIKIAIRLVPDQNPEEISASFHAWLAAHTPEGVEVTVTPAWRGGPPSHAARPSRGPDALRGHRTRVGQEAAIYQERGQRA